MFNKKVKAILFIFIILFCISAANAESIDNDSINIGSVNAADIESITLTSTIADEEVSIGDFSDLNTTINSNNNSTVNLDKDYIYNNTSDKDFKDGVVINRDLTIDGQGHSIDGNHTARIFNITSGASLTLKNIKLINGNATNGGAIYNDEGHVNVINATFIGNTAENGGAVYMETGDMDIIDSSFINNTASVSGGAVYSDIGFMDVINSTFTNNTASEDGGAIYNNGEMNVTNSAFNLNKAISDGGAIYSEIGGIDVIDSTFTLNSAENGGAIYNVLGNMNIISSDFTQNTAVSGGAIYSALDDMNIVESTFSNNTATNAGGAIYNNGDMDVTDSEFTLNSANDGAAIHTEIGNMNIVNSTFVNNNATQYGGAIYSDVGDLNVIDSEFNKNIASVSGGAIYNNGFIDVIDSQFNNNSAATSGGAIFNDGDINVTNSDFTMNSAAEGGAIYSKIGYINVIDSELNQNTAVIGGAIYNSGDMDVINSVFTQNKATNGAAIYTIDGNATITETTFTANNATNGGAIYYTKTESTSPDVSLNVMNSNFNDNHGDFGDDIYTTYTTNVLNNVYTKDSYANIYANNTVINGTVIVVLKNSTYFVPNAATIFKVNATAFVDGASIAGYDIVITDGEKTYNTTYLGDGVYEINENITANFTIKTYSAIINNTNDTNYEVEQGTVVNIKEINLEVNNLTKYYGNPERLTIKLTDTNGNSIANQDVTITINGRTYTRTTNANGTILMGINLNPGIYEATISYGNITKNVTVTVLTTIEGSNIVKFYKNGTQYYATFYDIDGKPLANTNVTFNINGVFYTRTTDANGTAKLNINLNPAEYIITAINPVTNQSFSNVVTVLSTISGNDVVKYFRNGTQYYATFLDENGNPLANTDVTFNINGVFYTRTTDDKGIAKLNINLNPGQYIITAINPNHGETYSNMIRVLSTIDTEDLEMFTINRKPFTATILDDQGNPLANAKVTFNINGVFYTKTTDASGVATLNINLIAGEYIITTMYNDLSVSNKIVII